MSNNIQLYNLIETTDWHKQTSFNINKDSIQTINKQKVLKKALPYRPKNHPKTPDNINPIKGIIITNIYINNVIN